MSKKKKHILEFEEEVNYELIGLCSHHSDYRLVWSINQQLGFALEKHVGYENFDKKGTLVSEHSMYVFEDENDRLTYYLIKNKMNGKFLIPELPAIDFFLFLCDNVAVDRNELITKLKSVPSVIAAYPFEADEIGSVQNIMFN